MEFPQKSVSGITLVLIFLVSTGKIPAASPVGEKTCPVLQVRVDATDLPRRLLHATMEIPAVTRPLVVWYPKWIPGVHAPGGPVQNLGGLYFETNSGRSLDWKRDPEELHRFRCEVPEDATRVVVRLDYICNQPSVNSSGVDSFGNCSVGILNWNTCFVYPEGFRNTEIEVELSLRLPQGWEFASALRVSEKEGGWIRFKKTTLQQIVDSPLVCGEFLRTVRLDDEKDEIPPHYLHLVSESETALEIDETVTEACRNLVKEAGALFGAFHYPEYHFLVVLSEEMPYLGLEHFASSLNGLGERTLQDVAEKADWHASLLPHEFVHSWCGKYRRPEKMCTGNYHTTKQTDLLWIYEGLTQYLGEVLTVRSGFLKPEVYLQQFTLKIRRLRDQKGRRWRPLEDTAVSNYILRRHSPNWGPLRRGQDYYNEGALIWMEADTLIRRKTDGTRSLDDFCKKFFGKKDEDGDFIVPYNLDEVCVLLDEIAEYDWQAFFEERVSRPHEDLPLDLVERLGYRLTYADEPSDYLKKRMKEREYVTAASSLGLEFTQGGKVSLVVPEMPGDRAGISPGMRVVAVNDRKFSPERLEDALERTVTHPGISFLVLQGDRYRTLRLNYDEGPKFLKLTRDEDKHDWFIEILTPKVPIEKN